MMTRPASGIRARPVDGHGLRCPHDQVPLERCERFEMIVFGCRWCRSLWLPAASWRRLCQRVGFAQEPMEDGDAPPRRSKRSCLACANERLLLQSFHGVEVDVCSRCSGVWLDHGEIQRLLGVPLPSRARPARVSAGSAGAGNISTTGDIVCEATAAGVEGLAGLLGELVSGLGDAV